MALMSDIANDALVELRFGSGQDVQIHLQEGLYATISRLYRTLMKKHVWRDYHSVNDFVIDGSTGQVTTSLTTTLTRYSNILAVYDENSSRPIPFAPVMVNPRRFSQPSLVASGDAKIFTIWPKADRNIVLISRFFTENNFNKNDDVPFYRDVLAVGAALQLSIKSGTNDALTKSLGGQFAELVEMYRLAELQNSYQISNARGGVPTDWYVDDPF